jgi:hypothetical protein
MTNDIIDFNDFEYGDLIPQGTIAVTQFRVKYPEDNAGADGVLRRTKNGDAEGLDLEVTLLDGKYARRKFPVFLLLKGSTANQKEMADKNKGKLRAAIDSAKFLDPQDKGPETAEKRKMPLRDFDGLRCLIEIGIEQGKDGFRDKNIIGLVITKDLQKWGGRPPIDQVAPDWGSGGAPPVPSTPGAPPAPSSPPPVQKPKWA